MTQVMQTDQRWIIEIPTEMARLMGVNDGSVGILHPKAGAIEVEVIPPLDPDIEASVLEGCEELREAFEELERRGD